MKNLIRLTALCLALALAGSVAFATHTASVIWEVEQGGGGGSGDSINGGGFDYSQTAGMFTDGAATSGNTSAPVFTSASYNFVAGDVGAWLFIGAGTNWTKGWYQIASVASNAATLNGTIGQAVALSPLCAPSTVVGCATTASPSGATWSIDYSQQQFSQFSYTDLASAGTGLTASSAAHPIGKQQVGNCWMIASGTNFTTGRYFLVSVSGVTGTFVAASGNMTTGAGSGGTGRLGGALATPGQGAVSAQVAGQRIYAKYSASDYTITTASAGAAGPVALASGIAIALIGYDVVRGDYTGRKPAMNWGAVAAPGGATYLMAHSSNVVASAIINFKVNCNSVNNVCGISCGGSNQLTANCDVINCNGTGGIGFSLAALIVLQNCSVTTGTTGITVATGGFIDYCSAIACVTGISLGASTTGVCTNSLAANCSGDGFNIASSGWTLIRNTSTGNTGDGFDSGSARIVVKECVATFNGGYAYNASLTTAFRAIKSVDYSNTSGRNPIAGIADWMPITLTADPYVNKSSGDYRPNYNAGGGLVLLGMGFGVPGQTNNVDLGAVQHADPALGYAN